MPVVSFDPPRALLRLQDALDQIQRNPLLRLTAFGPANPSVFPPINVFSDENSLVVRAEIPGFKQADLEVTVEAGRLTLGGRREREAAEEAGAYHRSERQFGTFSRTLQLPDDLDTDRATAACRDGVLTIRIPVRPEKKPRKVAVTQPDR